MPLPEESQSQETPASNGKIPSWAEEWDDEIKNSPTIQNLSHIEDPGEALRELGKMTVNAQKLVGDRGPVPPKKDAPFQEHLEYRRKAFGAPEKPEAYEAPKLDGIKEGLDESTDGFLRNIASQVGLNQAEYNAVYEMLAKDQESAPALAQDTLKEWYGEASASRVDRLYQTAIASLPKEAQETTKQLTQGSPELKVALAHFVSQMGEKPSVGPDSPSQAGSQATSLGEIKDGVQQSMNKYLSMHNEKGPNAPETKQAYSEWMKWNGKLAEANKSGMRVEQYINQLSS